MSYLSKNGRVIYDSVVIDLRFLDRNDMRYVHDLLSLYYFNMDIDDKDLIHYFPVHGSELKLLIKIKQKLFSELKENNVSFDKYALYWRKLVTWKEL